MCRLLDGLKTTTIMYDPAREVEGGPGRKANYHVKPSQSQPYQASPPASQPFNAVVNIDFNRKQFLYMYKMISNFTTMIK
jgi:hypothetical protein